MQRILILRNNSSEGIMFEVMVRMSEARSMNGFSTKCEIVKNQREDSPYKIPEGKYDKVFAYNVFCDGIDNIFSFNGKIVPKEDDLLAIADKLGYKDEDMMMIFSQIKLLKRYIYSLNLEAMDLYAYIKEDIEAFLDEADVFQKTYLKECKSFFFNQYGAFRIFMNVPVQFHEGVGQIYENDICIFFGAINLKGEVKNIHFKNEGAMQVMTEIEDHLPIVSSGGYDDYCGLELQKGIGFKEILGAVKKMGI